MCMYTHSPLPYGTIMWGPQNDIIKLLKLVCGRPPRGRCRGILKVLQAMTVPALFVIYVLK